MLCYWRCIKDYILTFCESARISEQKDAKNWYRLPSPLKANHRHGLQTIANHPVISSVFAQYENEYCPSNL